METEFLTQIALSGGFGIAVGVAIGFFVRKVLKFLAFLAGGIFLLLMYAQAGGYGSVNWGKIQNTTEIVVQNIASTGVAGNGVDSALQIIGIPFTGGMAVGFGIGLARG